MERKWKEQLDLKDSRTLLCARKKMLYFVVFLVSLSLPGTTANGNELWKRFIGQDGQRINKTKVFIQYDLLCPTLNGLGALASYKNEKVPKDICFKTICADYFGCLCRGSCCHTSAFGYLDVSFFDPLIFPSYDSGERSVMVKQCPYNLMDEMKQNCEDIELNPVTSTDTKITYKNEFCALCHGDKTFVKWNRSLRCSENQDNRTRTTKIQDYKRFCVIKYELLEPYRHLAVRCPPSLITNGILISKCNETGLWTEYDSDIEWACRRFSSSYKQFRNIFCYICNPGVVSTQSLQTMPLISTCNGDSSPGQNISVSIPMQSNTSIAEMCEISESVPRLKPFKNAYCFACYEPSNNSFDENIMHFSLFDIRMKTFLLKVTFNGFSTANATLENFENSVNHMVRFFINKTKVRSDTITMEFDMDLKTKINDPNMLINKWFDVCSVNNSCAKIGTKKFNFCQKCLCDQRCLLSKHDCCFDKLVTLQPYLCIPESSFQVLNNASRTLSSNKLTTHKLVSQCFGNSMYHHNCLHGNMSDPLTHIPVETTERSNLPFKNIYCLLCNVDTPINGIRIYLRVQCNDYFEVELLPTLQHILQSVKHHNCKVAFALDNFPMVTNECEITINDIVEHDRAFVCLSNSAREGTGKDIYNLCSDDEFPYLLNALSRIHRYCPECDNLFHPLSVTPKISTVVQCRKKTSNAISVEHLCFIDVSQQLESRSDSKLLKMMNYRSLFTVSGLEFERFKMMKSKRCRKGTFDTKTVRFLAFCIIVLYFLISASDDNIQSSIASQKLDIPVKLKWGTCRQLFCSTDRVLENGSCLNVFESIGDTTFLASMVLKVCDVYETNTENGTNNKNETRISAFSDYSSVLEELCNDIYKELHDTAGNETVFSYVRCHFQAYHCKSDYHQMQNVSENVFSEIWNLSNETILHANVSVRVLSSKHRSRIEKQLFDLMNHQVHKTSRVSFCQSSDTVAPEDELCGVLDSVVPNTETQIVTALSLVYIKKTLFCPLVEVVATNITLNQTTGEIIFHHLQTEISLPSGSVDFIEYTNLQWKLRICKNDLKISKRSLYHTGKPDLIRAYFLFSTSCNAVSLLSLCLTLLTYMMFKVLRTVPGRNNMNLALCLLLAQTSLQYPHYQQSSNSELQCQVLGVCIHFFWLATFCALNVCSFHMFKVFSGRLMLLHYRDESVFPKYTVYVYGCPTLITLAVMSVNVAVRGSIGYGVTRCFLDDFYSVIFTFLLPSSLIFITNIVFYGKTLHIIYNSPTLRSNIEERSTLSIYIKLCTITGMAWPLLIIDALFPLSVFSFFATFTNAMQGFFIFISFICNRRVWNLYKSYLFGSSEPDSVSSKLESLSRVKSVRKP